MEIALYFFYNLDTILHFRFSTWTVEFRVKSYEWIIVVLQRFILLKISAPPAYIQNTFLDNENIPKLNEEKRESYEGDFTINECLQVLKIFDCNK